MLLQNKIALITGAAKGIGRQCSIFFAHQNAKMIIIADLDEDQGKKTAEEINKSGSTRSIFVKTDVSKESDVEDVMRFAEREAGRIDILLNVAGICSVKSVFQEDMKGWDRMMDINLKGTFLFMRESFKLMQKQRYGKIVNVSSISGQVGGIRTSPAYAASKAGILSITKSFAKLGAKDNITVNAVAPGLIDTEMTNSPDFIYSLDEIPMGRIGSTEDVANAALFLASDLSNYITGQCINVNGGMYMA